MSAIPELKTRLGAWPEPLEVLLNQGVGASRTRARTQPSALSNDDRCTRVVINAILSRMLYNPEPWARSNCTSQPPARRDQV